MKILNEEFMELLVIALAQRVYELEQRLETLEEELEECKLRDIESRNPGIDIEEVRKFRASQRENMKES